MNNRIGEATEQRDEYARPRSPIQDEDMHESTAVHSKIKHVRGTTAQRSLRVANKAQLGDEQCKAKCRGPLARIPAKLHPITLKLSVAAQIESSI